MFRSVKRTQFFFSCFLVLSLAMLTIEPMIATAQDATAEATMATDSLPAKCGNTPGTIRDLASQIKADPNKTVKIGFLFVGPVDDFGYNYAANQGHLCLEAVYPGSTVYAENVPESAEAERVMENMIQAQV